MGLIIPTPLRASVYVVEGQVHIGWFMLPHGSCLYPSSNHESASWSWRYICFQVPRPQDPPQPLAYTISPPCFTLGSPWGVQMGDLAFAAVGA